MKMKIEVYNGYDIYQIVTPFGTEYSACHSKFGNKNSGYSANTLAEIKSKIDQLNKGEHVNPF